MLSLIVCLAILVVGETTEIHHHLSDEFINSINAQQTTWTAGRNFPEATTMEHFRNLLGAFKSKTTIELPTKQHDEVVIANLPESFDPRDKWMKCKSLNEIRDQGCCGSCWAVAAVSAMSDRICIYSKGTRQFQLSAQDLISCDKNCNGCEGGAAASAWKFWKDHGIVSGGNYNSTEGCRPYEIEPCKHTPDGTGKPCVTPQRTNACYDTCSMPNTDYKKDKNYAKTSYQIIPNEGHVKAELYTKGPVEATFLVYSDFAHYKSGVYQHVSGDLQGAHCVKLMGWGVENGTKYWLVANSWNISWGDKGFFKIIRGSDECSIERYVVAGDPQ